jgi:hypothetical protein
LGFPKAMTILDRLSAEVVGWVPEALAEAREGT